MNDSDFKSQIKALPVPQRGEDYWEAFPDRVVAELQAGPAPRARSYLPRLELTWLVRVAFACLLIGLCLCESRAPHAFSQALHHNEQQLRQTVERFDHNLSRLMADEHGLHRLVEDQP